MRAQPAAQATGSDAEARALFQAGEVAYGEGRFEPALDYFRRAYALSPRPQMLFNIGSAAEHLRRDEEALEALRDYLAALPQAPNREAVERRIEILEQAVAERASSSSAEGTPAAITPPVTTDTEPAPSADPAPWILVGIGGALLVAGAVMLAVGYADVATVEGARGVTWASLEGPYRDAPILTGAGWAGGGLGAAAVIAGIVWAAMPSSGEAPRVAAWLTPDTGGLLLRGAL